jgi:hypothetical protein
MRRRAYLKRVVACGMMLTSIGADSPETVVETTAAQSASDWSQQAKLTRESSGDQFGGSVEVSGNGSTAVIGASTDENPNGNQAGPAYVFSRSGGEWQQEAKLAADDGDIEDEIEGSVGVSGDGTTVLIGASADEDRTARKQGRRTCSHKATASNGSLFSAVSR